MKSHSGFETKVLAAFTAAVLVVMALVTTTWRMARDAAEASLRVVHTHEVLESLVRTKTDTLQIEFSTQSFRISGDPARLTERDAAVSDREATLRQVRQLTSDNAQQQERWTRLREVIDERLAIARRVELLRKTQGLKAASAYVAGAPLQETRERTYRLLREMEEEERQLLEARSAEQLRARQEMVAAGALVALLLLALLTATYVLIRRQLRQTEASRRALADSEQSLSTTLHSIGDAVLATDTKGCITRMNPVAQRLTGWSLAQARGRPVDDVFRIVNEQTRAPTEVPVAKVLATGEIQGLSNHTALVARDGSECPIADSAAPIRDATGRVSGVVLVFRDVSVERQAQRTVGEQNIQLEQHVRERTTQLQESEENFRSVISNVPAMIAYVDSQQRYVYVNQQYLARVAPGQADITGRAVRDILGQERYAVAAPLIAKAIQGERQGYDQQTSPGVWQAINYVPKRNAQDQVVGYYVLGTDITVRKQVEEKIQTLNAKLGQHVRELEHVTRALRTLSAGNRTMLRATDERGLLDSMCEAIVTSGGYYMAVVWYGNEGEPGSLRPMAESGDPAGLAALRMLKSRWTEAEQGQGLIATAIQTGHTSMLRDMLADPNYAPLQPHLQGHVSGIACPLRIGGTLIGAIAIYGAEPDTFDADEVLLLTESADDLAYGIATLRARVEQQINQETMRRLSRFDALTGLPNETQFTEFLVAAIETGQRLDQPFAVLQTNIERLREINDALGFSQGDSLLREFGARMSAAAPTTAQVARLRGDEFAILLPDTNANGALAMAQDLERVLTQPFPIADIALDVSMCIGVALFPEHGVTAHDLFRHMDIAVNEAKAKGVSHLVFNPAGNQHHPSQLAMPGELRRAIEGGELVLYLQPKVEIASGRVCGAEGLVRWQHPKRGLLQPVDFIGLAEQTGLIKPLTEWVVEAGLRLNQAWGRQGCALPIAINLSARNLRDEDLLDKIRQLQSIWGVAAGLLELEVTESAVMEDAEFALRVLHDLRNEGIPLYIDDFGTGYSSLSYLQMLPVDYIKIDQSFVRDMTLRRDSAAIVRSTIDLAHDLGRKVVAEGVETQAHWDQLAAFGCDIAQGYFIARPMPDKEFPNWMQQFRAPVTTVVDGKWLA